MSEMWRILCTFQDNAICQQWHLYQCKSCNSTGEGINSILCDCLNHVIYQSIASLKSQVGKSQTVVLLPVGPTTPSGTFLCKFHFSYMQHFLYSCVHFAFSSPGETTLHERKMKAMGENQFYCQPH